MGYLNPIQLAALIIAGLVLIAFDAHSRQGTTWGEYHVGSNHSQSYYYDETGRHDFNENNTGGGISHEVSNNFEVGAGFFKNSYSNTSMYGGIDIHTSRARYVSIGVSLGPITGYADTPQGNRWMILPNLVFGNDRIRTKIGYIPGDVSVTTLTIGVGF